MQKALIYVGASSEVSKNAIHAFVPSLKREGMQSHPTLLYIDLHFPLHDAILVCNCNNAHVPADPVGLKE